jgi:hypothetical protein
MKGLTSRKYSYSTKAIGVGKTAHRSENGWADGVETLSIGTKTGSGMVLTNPEFLATLHFLSALRATKRHSAFPLSPVKNLAKDFNAPILGQT